MTNKCHNWQILHTNGNACVWACANCGTYRRRETGETEMEKAMQLVMELPDWVKESVIDMQTGTLPINGKRCDVVAVILEKVLTADETTEIKRFRKCVKVSCGHMQYAPEIKHSVVYFKY